MSGGGHNALLVEAAIFERDRRFALAPEAIRQAAVGEDGPAQQERIIIGCQCWTAIAEWLETDRFFSFAGGGSPQEPDAPWISWPELEAAAAAALASVTALCDRLFTAETVAAGEYEAACERRSALWKIHRAVSLHRTSIDWINAGVRERRKRGIAQQGEDIAA